jgi:hypothetical protein
VPTIIAANVTGAGRNASAGSRSNVYTLVTAGGAAGSSRCDVWNVTRPPRASTPGSAMSSPAGRLAPAGEASGWTK